MLPEGREYNTGTNIDILCEITGQPEPEVIWYKDDQVIHETDHVKFMGIKLMHEISPDILNFSFLILRL